MFFNNKELQKMGFASLGKNVKISIKASLYGVSRISIGNNVRIDDFCVLSAGENGIEIGNYVHISFFCSIIGPEKVILKDFSGLSSRVSIYSSSDDYSGNYLTNPTVDKSFTNMSHGPVTLNKHVIIGSTSVILPNVEIGEGSAVGALSLVAKSCGEFQIISGVPAKFIMFRSKKLLKLVNQLY